MFGVHDAQAQNLFNAMKRKGWSPSEHDMKQVVAIHNGVNERAWSEVCWASLHVALQVARLLSLQKVAEASHVMPLKVTFVTCVCTHLAIVDHVYTWCMPSCPQGKTSYHMSVGVCWSLM